MSVELMVVVKAEMKVVVKAEMLVVTLVVSMAGTLVVRRGFYLVVWLASVTVGKLVVAKVSKKAGVREPLLAVKLVDVKDDDSAVTRAVEMVVDLVVQMVVLMAVRWEFLMG